MSNKEEKAKEEKPSEANPKVVNNILKAEAMDSKEREKMDPKMKVCVNEVKGRNSEDSTPFSPGTRSKASGSIRAEDRGDPGNQIPDELRDENEKKGREIKAEANTKPDTKKDFTTSEEVCRAIAMEMIEAVFETETKTKAKPDDEEKKVGAKGEGKVAEEESVNGDEIFYNP